MVALELWVLVIEFGDLAFVGQVVYEDDEIAAIGQIREWLATPSLYLAEITPLEMIRAGRVDKARGALEVLRSGIFI